MDNGRIPKDILYGGLASGKTSIGHPNFRYKYAYKHDLRALDIDTNSWEGISADRNKWQ